MRMLFTGGGTAGHINPALAAAGYLKSLHPSAEILFVGNKGGMEEKLIPPAGYDIKCIRISGFQRKISAKNAVKNVKTIVRMFTASAQAKNIIKEFNPDVCVGTGGYVSGPVIREACKLGIPCVIHESNAFPGVTTKMLAKKVHTLMLASADAKKYFSEEVKIEVTGNPIREEILKASSEEVRREMGFDERPLILSVGGSLGAEKVNAALIPILKRSLKDGRYQHIHSAGYGKISDELQAISKMKNKSVLVKEYVNMADCLAAADVVISRAGAITVTEIEARGKASILIPSPNVAENHQFHNAMSLVNAGAAEIIEEKNLTSEILESKLDSILESESKVQKMGENAKKMYIEDVNEKIYNIIIKAAKSKK